MELSQVVGIVTGGAAGIGRGFADAILSGGGKVLITDVDSEQLEATGQELQSAFGAKNVAWLRQDVTDAGGFHEAFDYAIKYFETHVNLLANNAGIISAMNYYADGAPRDWERVVSIDLISVMRGTQVAIEYFKKLPSGQEGVIANVSSVAGLHAVPFWPDYAAAKAGVVALTRSLFQLKQSHNIRGFALAPGFADTALGRFAVANLPEEVRGLGELMQVSEVVDAFVAAVREPANAGRVLSIASNSRSYHAFPGDEQLFPNSEI
ncbi:hypothetical protein PybrP1_008457 [[Pythium] brassicae (nom. inval.)]|nr:hypothetical protein PybrP1_008457 [[Pythium] brassicae (nom. inval.)]